MKTNVQILPAQIGKKVTFEVKDHASSCKEFVVTSPEFSIRKWLLWTIILNLIGFILKLHTQDSRIMVAVLCVLLLALMFKLHTKVKKESLLIAASIGVQLTTTFASGRKLSQFYDESCIKDIVINEGITLHRVIYYLALLLRKDGDSSVTSSLVPLFQHSWPGLACLKQIYQGSQKVLRNQTLQHRSKGGMQPHQSQLPLQINSVTNSFICSNKVKHMSVNGKNLHDLVAPNELSSVRLRTKYS